MQLSTSLSWGLPHWALLCGTGIGDWGRDTGLQYTWAVPGQQVLMSPGLPRYPAHTHVTVTSRGLLKTSNE